MPASFHLTLIIDSLSPGYHSSVRREISGTPLRYGPHSARSSPVRQYIQSPAIEVGGGSMKLQPPLGVRTASQPVRALFLAALAAAMSFPAHAQYVTTTLTSSSDSLYVAVNPVTNRIYLPNVGVAGFTVLSGTTHSVLAYVNTPSVTTLGAMAVDAATNRIYALGNVGYAATGNQVVVIDGASNSVIATIPMPACQSQENTGPTDLVVNTTGNKVYVLCQANVPGSGMSDALEIIDGATNTSTSIAVHRAEDVAVNQVTNKVYFAQVYDSVDQHSGSIMVLDGATNAVTANIFGTPGDFTNLSVNSATNKVYAVDLYASAVDIIDGASDTVTGTVAVNSAAFSSSPNYGGSQLVADPINNKIYVPTAPPASSPDSIGVTTVIDGATNSTSQIDVYGALFLDAVNNKIYVDGYPYSYNYFDYAAPVIDGATGSVAAIPAAGFDWPGGRATFAVNPVTKRAYIASSGGSGPIYGVTEVPNTNVGSSSSFTLPYQFSWSTAYLAAQYTLSAVTVAGVGPSDFSLASGTTCLPGTYSNEQTCQLIVQFDPTALGLRNATLTLKGTFTASGSTTEQDVSIPLSGLGTGSQVSVSPGLISNVAGKGTAGYTGDGGIATTAQLKLPFGSALDTAGNLYIADSANQVVRRVDALTGQITTVAGTGTEGFTGDGQAATSADLAQPSSVAIDGAGNLYIADSANDRIREVDSATKLIHTVAGGGSSPLTSGVVNNALQTALSWPRAVVADGSGNLFIAEGANVEEVYLATGGLLGIAGTGAHGYNGDDTLASGKAQLNYPWALALDAVGDLYIADRGNHRIRRVNLAANTITTVAGTGVAGNSGDYGVATSAELFLPSSVAVDAAGDIYIADSENARVRKIDASTGIINTVVGTTPALNSESIGDGGPSTSAQLSFPVGVTLDAVGDLYVTDRLANVVRKVTASGAPLPFAETPVGTKSADLQATVANIGNLPLSLSSLTASANYGIETTSTCQNSSLLVPGSSCAVVVYAAPTVGGDPAGTLTLTDNAWNSATQQVALSIGTTGNSSLTLAPASVGGTGTSSPLTVNFTSPAAVATVRVVTQGVEDLDFTAGAGTNCAAGSYLSGQSCRVTVEFTPKAPGMRLGAVQLLDAAGNVVYQKLLTGVGQGSQVELVPGVITTAAGNATAGNTGDGGPATSAELTQAYGAAVDAGGNLYIADQGSHTVRRVDGKTDVITTVAGTGTEGFSGDGQPAASAQLAAPQGVAVDGAGNLYIADSANNRIRKVDAVTGIITTVAGDGAAGYSGDNQPAVGAELNWPFSVTVDGSGSLYIPDANHTVRKVDGNGVISTVAGTGVAGRSAGVAATNAQLNNPWSVAVDAAGNLFIADRGNGRICEVDATTGLLDTIVGQGGKKVDTSDPLYLPSSVAVDASGSVYYSVSGYGQVYKVAGTATLISQLALAGGGASTGDGGSADGALLAYPTGLAMDGSGNLFITDSTRVRKVSASGAALTFSPSGQSLNTYLTNSGNTELNLSTVTLQNTKVGFSDNADCITASGTSAVPSAAVPGSYCLAQVTFTSKFAGTVSTTLTFIDDALNKTGSQQTVTLNGATLSPSSLPVLATCSR